MIAHIMSWRSEGSTSGCVDLGGQNLNQKTFRLEGIRFQGLMMTNVSDSMTKNNVLGLNGKLSCKCFILRPHLRALSIY